MSKAKKEIKTLMKSATPEQKAFVRTAVKDVMKGAREAKRGALEAKLAVLRKLGIAPAAKEAPKPVAPKSAVASAPPTLSKKDAYKALREKNPHQAAQFYAANQQQIDQDIS